MPMFVRGVILSGALLPLAYYVLAIASGRRFFASSSGRPQGAAPTRDQAQAAVPASGHAAVPVASDIRRGRPSCRPLTDGASWPPVSILKPVRGLDHDSYGNFLRFAQIDYPEYEILFAVADEDDPVIPIIRRVMADCPSCAIRLLVGAPALGESSKVNKLCRLAREARYDALVINDSDIRVEPGYLRTVMAALDKPGVGLVTCLYTGIRDGSLGADLESLAIATDFAPSVIVAWRLEGVRFALGATMALTRSTLAAIGGFEALVDYCAEDFELGRRVAAHGLRVELLGTPVRSECVTSAGAFVRHALRWAVTRRHSRPGGHWGLIVTQGLPWTIAAACVAPSTAVAVAYPAAYLTLRLVLAWTIGVRGLGDRGLLRRWWLMPISDGLAFGVWMVSLFRNRIDWRGRRFDLDHGRLVPVQAGRPSQPASRL
jgi:ceramide glucosyltransferase